MILQNTNKTHSKHKAQSTKHKAQKLPCQMLPMARLIPTKKWYSISIASLATTSIGAIAATAAKAAATAAKAAAAKAAVIAAVMAPPARNKGDHNNNFCC